MTEEDPAHRDGDEPVLELRHVSTYYGLVSVLRDDARQREHASRRDDGQRVVLGQPAQQFDRRARLLRPGAIRASSRRKGSPFRPRGGDWSRPASAGTSAGARRR